MKDRRKFFKMSGGGALGLASMSLMGFLPFKLFSKENVARANASQRSDFKVEAHPMAISRNNKVRKGVLPR